MAKSYSKIARNCVERMGLSNCGISTVDCAWHAQLGLEVGS